MKADKGHRIIRKCREDIIKKFVGDSPLKFSHADFSKLSDDIFDITKISISISTLKRIWKDDFKNYPNISTLDAFAQYLGYKNWRVYCNQFSNRRFQGFRYFKARLRYLILIAGGLLVASATIFFVFIAQRTANFTDYNDIKFEFKEFDSTQIPLYAVFSYNIRGLKFKSATIRPLGTAEDEFAISPNDSIATYTYLRPWNYSPTLVLDGKQVKSLNIHFAAGQWKAGLSNTRNKFYIKYFDDEEIYKNGRLHFTTDLVNQKNFPVKEIEYITYDLFKKFEDINGDSLHYKTRIKNTIITREENCGNINIGLCFETGSILIPLAIEKSPYGPLTAAFFDIYVSGKTHDVSFLYHDLEKWNTFEVITRNKNISILANDSVIYSTNYTQQPGKLTGISFDFKGWGEVDYVRFYNPDDKLIYDDEFE